MLRIIDGLRYNTETSELVAMAENRVGYKNLNWWRERLYKTQKGAWFLVGEGNGLSKYCERIDNNAWGSGCKLVAMTSDEARTWLEQNIKVDALETHFSEEIEDA